MEQMFLSQEAPEKPCGRAECWAHSRPRRCSFWTYQIWPRKSQKLPKETVRCSPREEQLSQTVLCFPLSLNKKLLSPFPLTDKRSPGRHRKGWWRTQVSGSPSWFYLRWFCLIRCCLAASTHSTRQNPRLCLPQTHKISSCLSATPGLCMYLKCSLSAQPHSKLLHILQDPD